MPFSGCFFTLSNKREGAGFIARKLDHVLANASWMGMYGKTLVEFLEGCVSDHSASIIFVGKLVSYGPRPLKFFSFWADHPQYLHWVEES